MTLVSAEQLQADDEAIALAIEMSKARGNLLATHQRTVPTMQRWINRTLARDNQRRQQWKETLGNLHAAI